MHDPMTVAFEIGGLITVWHVDPERGGGDDSCDWFGHHRRLSKREQAIMEAVWNLQTAIENEPVFGSDLYPSIDDRGPLGGPWVELNAALREWTRRPRWRLHPRWHVWHWKIQVHPVQQLKRRLFSRCDKCGGRFAWGESPVSSQWNGGGPRWFRGETNVHHVGCSQ